MASLSELVQYAQYLESQQLGPKLLNTAIAGAEQGYNDVQMQKKAQLERSMKLLDMQEKQMKLVREQQQYNLTQNMMKFVTGATDSNDAMAARATAGVSLGKPDDPLLSKPATPQGKLQGMWEASEMDISPTGGITFKIKNKNMQTKNRDGEMTEYQKAELDRQRKADLDKEKDDILKHAAASAVQDISNNPKDMRGKNYNMGLTKQIIPTRDEVLAKVPEAYKFKKGSLNGYQEFQKLISGSANPTAGLYNDPNNPLPELGQ